MTVAEMYAKSNQANGNAGKRSLKTVQSGGSAEDFVQDGMLVRIVEESKDGFFPKNFSENAVYVIMEQVAYDDNNNVVAVGAVQVNLSMFDRVATPFKKEADGTVVRDLTKETVRAEGSVVNDWKRAANAEEFMINNKGKIFKISLLDTVTVRAWDRAAKAFSNTETREQKVYKSEWV